MKILFVDPVCWKEHITYNQFWIETLNISNISYDTAFVQGYQKLLNAKLINAQNYEIAAPYGNSGLINNTRFLWHLYYKVNVRSYQYIVFSSINKLAFLCSPFFWSAKAIIVSHSWKTPITVFYKLLLKIISSKHILISLDNFIYEYLRNNKIRTHVIPHPIVQPFTTNTATHKEKQLINIFAPSKSIDKELLDSLYKDTTLNNWLKEHKIKLHIRNHIYTQNSSNLIFSTGYIQDSEYKNLFLNADIILIAYPSTFTNRVSNVFYEAIGNKKHIILLKGTHLDNYANEYDPNHTIIKPFNDIFSLKDVIINTKGDQKILSQLITEHSLINMQKHFLSIVNK